MSHAALVNYGLWVLTIASAVVLVMFVSAVVRMPPELAKPAAEPAPEQGQWAEPAPEPRRWAEPAPEPPRWAEPAPEPGQWAAHLPQESPPVPLPRRPAPDGGYVARHASPRGGPPWGPAPKPPGMDQLPAPG